MPRNLQAGAACGFMNKLGGAREHNDSTIGPQNWFHDRRIQHDRHCDHLGWSLRVVRPLRADTVLFLSAPLILGMWSLWLGQDANWDLRNYHWYDAYLLLDWRFDRDIAPAGIQTFQSSLLDVPWFLLAKWLPGPAVGFVIGAVQSANFVLLYMLARRMLRGLYLPLLIAVIGVAAPTSRNLIGTTFCDFLLAICVIGALYLTSVAIDPKDPGRFRVALCAGLVLGFAVAGKLTAAPYAVAGVASIAVIALPWRDKARLGLAMSLGGLAAGVVFLAPWCWWIYHLYGSPTFPFLNSVFHSPWTTLPDRFNMGQEPPHGLLAWLAYPYDFTRDPRRISAIGAQDYRLLAGYFLIPTALAVRWLLRAPPIPQPTRYLICFTAISYVLWSALLNVDRYAVPIAMLVPLLIAALLFDLAVPLLRPVLAVVLASLIFLGGGSYERVTWSKDFISADLPPITDPARTLVVFVNKPLGYLGPLLPEQSTIVLLDDELSPLFDHHAPWTRHLIATIDKPWVDIIGFVAGMDVRQYEAKAEAVGLTIDIASCRPVPNTFAHINFPAMICRLGRKAV